MNPEHDPQILDDILDLFRGYSLSAHAKSQPAGEGRHTGILCRG